MKRSRVWPLGTSTVLLGICILSLLVSNAAAQPLPGANGNDSDKDDKLDCGSLPILRVPSAQYPTIQSAVDAVPVGGATVKIAPGVYTESVEVNGSNVRLVGSGAGRTQLLALSGAAPGISFGAGASGVVEAITIAGGRSGIEGAFIGEPPPPPSMCSEPAGLGQPPQAGGPSIAIRQAVIARSGRGILGSFSSLALQGVTIANTVWNGMSILAAASLQARNVVVEKAGGVGILVENLGFGTGFVFDAVAPNDNKCGGIEVDGNATPVTIRSSFFFNNGRAGIFINNSFQVGTAPETIEETYIVGTQPDPFTGALGDGIDAVLSTVSVNNWGIQSSARAGIGNFGSTVNVANVLFDCNAIDLDGEFAKGVSYHYDLSGGGDVCECNGGVGQCQVLSSNLAPPMAVQS